MAGSSSSAEEVELVQRSDQRMSVAESAVLSNNNSSGHGSMAPAALDPADQKRVRQWEKEGKEERKSTELYRARCTSHKTEMYQLMGFYIVFQGVVFNTATTSPKLTCQTSLLPVLLSSVVLIATWVSVGYKLADLDSDQHKLIDSENDEEYIRNKITLLSSMGSKFDHSSYKLEKKKPYPSLRKTYWAIVLFLVIFSFIIMASCVIVRCWDTETGKRMLCFFPYCVNF